MVDTSMFIPIISSFLLGVCGGFLAVSGISTFMSWFGGISAAMAIVLLVWTVHHDRDISIAVKDTVIRDNIIVAPEQADQAADDYNAILTTLPK